MILKLINGWTWLFLFMLQTANAQTGLLFIPNGELSRIHIQNIKSGKIQGSKDGGKTWTLLGHVVKPAEGGIWLPAIDNGVTAFNYLRGPSNVFASAINNIHIRFSDPKGYELPRDTKIQPIQAHGITIAPAEAGPKPNYDSNGRSRTILTDIPGGTGIYSSEWSPRVGSKVVMGKGTQFVPIPYSRGPNANVPLRSELIIVTYQAKNEVESIELENKDGGKVWVKRTGENRVEVARVQKPVRGIGRYIGSQYLQKPGQVRANHAGVLDIGTTDINVDTKLPIPIAQAKSDINYYGGFQIVPSFHWNDIAMENAHKVEWVYAVIEPIQPPAQMERYDQGLEGSYPLFKDGARGGTGTTYFKFQGDQNWYELLDAQRLGKFKREDGSVVDHLRGHIKDALQLVTDIKIAF